MGVAQRASIGVPPRRFSKPTLQHYIGSMEVHLMSGKGLNQSHPELRESPFYCCLELGYQSVESRQQKGPSPMWDQKFILSLADFEEELNGSIHIARRYAPAGMLNPIFLEHRHEKYCSVVFVGKFKLPLGFLEYCGGSKPSLTHLDLTSSLGLQTGQLTLKITFKQF